jgi:putative toxin-antitoxin system antitoxin component (TIGR02293 family)
MSKTAAMQIEAPEAYAAMKSRAYSAEETLLRSIFGVGTGKTASKKPSERLLHVEAYRAAPISRIRLIKGGISAKVVEQLAKDMGIPKERLSGMLGLARATIDRKVREDKPLSSDEGSRVLGMASLIGQVQTMIEESGNPEGFNAAEWVARWLDRPLPALAGQKPGELMDTSDGQALVSDMVAAMQSGVYV